MASHAVVTASLLRPIFIKSRTSICTEGPVGGGASGALAANAGMIVPVSAGRPGLSPDRPRVTELDRQRIQERRQCELVVVGFGAKAPVDVDSIRLPKCRHNWMASVAAATASTCRCKSASSIAVMCRHRMRSALLAADVPRVRCRSIASTRASMACSSSPAALRLADRFVTRLAAGVVCARLAWQDWLACRGDCQAHESAVFSDGFPCLG